MMRQRSDTDSAGPVRICHTAMAANTGTENSILNAITVTASMWYRYISLATIALVENSTAPPMAMARPASNAGRAIMGELLAPAVCVMHRL